MILTIHTDGGARGNPGPAAIGVVISNGTDTLHEFGKPIGETTNNVAEYTAVIEALTWIRDTHANNVQSLHFVLDSVLVVNQIQGIFKVKEPHLQDLVARVHTLMKALRTPTTYTAVRREFNKRADFLVNRALDTQAQA